MTNARTGPSWTRAGVQLALDLRLGAILVALLLTTRLVLFAFFHQRMGDGAGLSDVLAMVTRGLRFDLRTAIELVAPMLPLSLACAWWSASPRVERLRRIYTVSLVALTVVLTGFDVGYFMEYGDQFNAYAFGILTDDLGAIVRTMIHQYSLHLLLPLLIAASAVLGWLVARTLRPHPGLEARLERLGRGARVALPVVLCAGLTVGFVGRIDRAMVRRDAVVGTDELLDKLVLNPYQRLYYAVKEHLAVTRGNSIKRFLPDEDVRAAAMRAFELPAPPDDLDAAALKVAPGRATGVKPRHVFFIVMESESAWMTWPKYRSLGLAEGLLGIASKGLFLPRVVSGGHLTIWSLNGLLTGIPDAGMAMNYHPAARTPFPTSIAPQLAALGYRTRFFTGSLLSWQWIGAYAKNQGFEEVVGGGSMAIEEATDWGVPDRYLFEHVARTVDPNVPSFNFILTTSNHAPFDVKDTGSPLKALPPELIPGSMPSVDLHALGHAWYADHHLARFVEETERRCAQSLFVITGDHAGRVFVALRPTVEEAVTVPLVLYGPEVLGEERFPEGLTSASHFDLVPTLMHLAAPAGHEYHSWGRDLFAPPPADGVSLGRNAVLTPKGAVDFGVPPGSRGPARVEGPFSEDELDRLRRRVDDQYALAIHRIRNGPALPPRGPQPPR